MKYNKIPLQDIIDKTISAVEKNGVNVEFVNTKEEALKKLSDMIPEGSEIMTGGSTTLDEIGFTDILKNKNHKWKNLKDEILAEKDSVKQGELRKKSVTSEYFIGSVHAVTEEGETITASNTGSQLPAYAFSSENVIWIVGTQKIVPNIKEGLKRIREYVFPLEDKRMKNAGYPGSSIGKILIFENENKILNRKITLIFVNEKLGF